MPPRLQDVYEYYVMRLATPLPMMGFNGTAALREQRVVSPPLYAPPRAEICPFLARPWLGEWSALARTIIAGAMLSDSNGSGPRCRLEDGLRPDGPSRARHHQGS